MFKKKAICMWMALLMLTVYLPAAADTAEARNVAEGKVIAGFSHPAIGAGNAAEKLIDGTPSSAYLDCNQGGGNGWIKVDLLNYYTIEEIVYVSSASTDGGTDAQKADIYVSVENVAVEEMTLVGGAPEDFAAGGASYSVTPDPGTAYRYVAIRKRVAGGPFLCSELKVMSRSEPEPLSPNVALGKRIAASSHPAIGAGNAIEKILDGDEGSSAYMNCNQGGGNGWIKVDLLNYYTIEEIVYVSSKIGDGGATAQMADIYVSIEDVAVEQMTKVGGAPENFAAGGASYSVMPDPDIAYRYVAIRKRVAGGPFICAELKVLSSSKPEALRPNVAEGKRAEAASHSALNGYEIEKILDGDEGSSAYLDCNQGGGNGWIKVDLLNYYNIAEIVYVSSKIGDGGAAAQMADIYVSVENVAVEEMTKVGGAPEDFAAGGASYSVTPDPGTAYRYVAIRKRVAGGPFLCAELKVYADIHEDVKAISLTKNDGDVTAAVTIWNYDLTGTESYEYVFFVVLYDEGGRASVTARRYSGNIGANELSQTVAIDEGTVSAKAFLIRSLEDARMLTDMVALQIK